MVRIIGVGNPLRGDDGFGVEVVARLAQHVLPPGVEVIDGGTGGFTVLGLMEGADRVVLVDAAQLGLRAGSVCRFSGEELWRSATAGSLTAHPDDLGAVLALGRELGVLPELCVILVQVAQTGVGQGLSPALAGAVDRVIALIRQELAV